MNLTESQLEKINHWRDMLDANLRKDVGWMTLAGLFWLEPGDNKIGAHPDNEISLPPGSSPDLVGILNYKENQVHLNVEKGITVTSDGATIEQIEIKPDSSGEPTTPG